MVGKRAGAASDRVGETTPTEGEGRRRGAHAEERRDGGVLGDWTQQRSRGGLVASNNGTREGGVGGGEGEINYRRVPMDLKRADEGSREGLSDEA